MSRKVALFALMSLVFIVGCPPKQYRHDVAMPNKNEVKIAGVGDEFFRHELMYGDDNYAGSVFNGEATMFSLTVVSLNEKTLSLQYREFTKPVAGPYGGFKSGGGWLIKEGYNQKYDYELTNKTIRFQNYEFEIVGFKDGRIQYKRIL
jgi:hypothetical protein